MATPLRHWGGSCSSGAPCCLVPSPLCGVPPGRPTFLAHLRSRRSAPRTDGVLHRCLNDSTRSTVSPSVVEAHALPEELHSSGGTSERLAQHQDVQQPPVPHDGDVSVRPGDGNQVPAHPVAGTSDSGVRPIVDGFPSPSSSQSASPPTQPQLVAVERGSGGAGNGPGSNGSSSRPSGAESAVSEPQQTPEEAVAAALARAQAAMSYAESSLISLEDLPSAREPSQWAAALRLARTVGIVATLCVAMVASHAMGLWVQLISALAGAVGIAWWGHARSALSVSGAAAALGVGWATLGCSLRFGATLLAFFFSSSKLTAYKEELKSDLDDASKAGGQRDWKQVLCNGGIPTLIALGYGILVGCMDVPLGPSPHSEVWRAKLATLLEGAFLGYYSCCCGDTWASELGPLSPDTPRLITNLRPVRKGTNGGVTVLGLAASVLGGAFMGTVFYLAALVSPTLVVLEGQQAAAVGQWKLVLLGVAAGLVGSLIDSLLGATVQYTGYNRTTGRVTSKPGPEVTYISGYPLLDNNLVNTVSASITAGLTALAALLLFRF